ncbi:MAG: hypothetical protein EPO51_04720 [Phenylobacterium sp.]|uniref:hypothetical protein n=1 Tax=Phenylobacterium sp. TaxID=1871053 RepID=UPI0011FB5271|nr:hypothetical protein [Phenylobacterium sp.]TAJ73598.1 MAG: hypothetical protein EPO51_04720 [Phenylobacterium sp.]
MRWPPTPIQSRVERLTIGLLGATLMASAALSADLARDHMALRGVVCGVAQVPHCGWCYAAVAFALAGLAAWVAALSPARIAT